MSSDSLWLIRTHLNRILGPYSQEEIRRALTEGRLQGEDEVCRANHYWFNLNDPVEVPLQLGMSPLGAGLDEGDEEITETDTDTQTTRDVVIKAADDLPELDTSGMAEEDQTAILSKGALRQASGTPAQTAPSASAAGSTMLSRVSLEVSPKPQRQPSSWNQDFRNPPLVERPSVWRGLASAFMFLIAVLLFMVIRILRQ